MLPDPRWALFPLENPNPVFRATTSGVVELANAPAQGLLAAWGGALPADLVAALPGAGPGGSERLVAAGDRWYGVRLVRPAGAPYVYGYAADQTALVEERRRVELLASFPEELADPVVRLDAERRVRYANAAAAPLLDRWRVALGEVLPEEPAGELALPDGRVLRLSAHASPGRDAVWVQAQDVTAEHRAARAEAASAAKSAFLSHMSHELRTPLNAILGYTELALDELVGPEVAQVRADLERVLRSAEHLLGVVTSVLDLSKVEAGRLELERSRLDLVPVLRDVADAVAPLVRRNGNALEVELPPRLEIETDEQRVRQILLNLLGNAAKFTQGGAVALRAEHGGGAVSIAVRDTGIGMDAEALGRVFDPFEQADLSTTRRYGGTGLGLTISRRLAELLGGGLVAESTPGRGSTFTLTLPG